MKNFIVVVITTFFSCTIVNAGMIYVPVSKESKNEIISFYDAIKKMDAKTFLSLTPLQVKAITGKKMSLKEKVVLKFAQREVKKQLKSEKEINVAKTAKGFWDNFSLGGYLLGFFLSLIGVLIVYLTNWEDPSAARKSAWSGFLTGAAVAFALAGF